MSDTAPDTGPDTNPTDAPDTDTTDWKAEAEKWQALSRKHESREKVNADAAKELEKLRQSSMSETEKAVALARAEGEHTGRQASALRLVDAEFKVAASGRSLDIDALLEGVDRTRFISDDGEPDTSAIAKWVDRIAPKPDEKDDDTEPSPFLDLGQGSRRTSPALNGDPLLRDLKAKLGI